MARPCVEGCNARALASSAWPRIVEVRAMISLDFCISSMFSSRLWLAFLGEVRVFFRARLGMIIDTCIYAEIKTRILDTISWDYDFEHAGSTPLTFIVKVHVIFRGDGVGPIDFTYYANADILIAFHYDCQVSHRYKYKFLKATTSNIPSSVIRDNRGSKLTISKGGLPKVQHLVSMSRSSASHTHIEAAGYQPPSQIAYIVFFVKPEEDEGTAND
ncbi:hypothetical protein UlMin_024500 [Ulmus minor]